MKIRVLRPFTMGTGRFQENQEIILEDWKCLRLVGEGLVEIVGNDDKPEVMEYVPSPEPIKKKRGRPMKSIIKSLIVFAFVFGMAHVAKAASYTVAVTTYTPTGSAGEYSGGSYPNIATGARIRNIIVSNAGATAQTITLWKDCTAYNACTKLLVYDIPASIGSYVLPGGMGFVPGILTVKNLAIQKSSASSVVNVTIIYE